MGSKQIDPVDPDDREPLLEKPHRPQAPPDPFEVPLDDEIKKKDGIEREKTDPIIPDH